MVLTDAGQDLVDESNEINTNPDFHYELGSCNSTNLSWKDLPAASRPTCPIEPNQVQSGASCQLVQVSNHNGSRINTTIQFERHFRCPTGQQRVTDSNGVVGCVAKHDDVCKFGNPVGPGSGAKYEEELDYRSGDDFPLELRRYYYSFGFYRPASAPGNDRAGGFTSHWSHGYALRVYPGFNSTLSAVAVRANGDAWYFGPTGAEVLNHSRNGAAARIVALPGGGWQLTLAKHDVETYSAEGRLLSITRRGGPTISITYDTAGRISSVQHSSGRALTFAYDSAGRVASVTTPSPGVITYGYSSSDLESLTSVTYADGTSKTYHYENTNSRIRLTGISDENNQRFSTYTYRASNGWVTSSEHAGQTNRYQFRYLFLGNYSRATEVTDPLGRVRTVSNEELQGVFRMTSVTGGPCESCGGASAVSYDTQGNVLEETDFNGNKSRYGFDLIRNLETLRTEAFGTARARSVTTQWHPTFRFPTEIRYFPDASTTSTPFRIETMGYDTAGNLLTKTETDSSVTPNVARTWSYTYDSIGRVLTADGPRVDVSDVTTCTYYNCTSGAECGQVHTIQNAAGHITTFNSYNADGQPLVITNPSGTVTTLTYDLRQRVTSRTVNGETTSFEYWPTGLLKKTTLSDGSYVSYTHDNAHRLIRIEDGQGNRVEYTLDNMGNRVATNVYDHSSVLARTRAQVFNSLNQLWKQIGSAGTEAVTPTYTYDPNSNPTSISAPLGRTTGKLYDELNRLKQITNPGSASLHLAYDADDNVTSITDPKGLVTNYSYNGFGERTQQASPDTGTTVNTYGSAGNLATVTDARGKVGTYSHDALNRVTSIAYPDGTTTFTYDSGTHGVGRLTGASDASHSMAWSYDAQGRVTGKAQTVGSVTRSVGYGYVNGNLTSLVTPSGQTVTYGYTNGRVSTITLNGGTTILNNVLYEPFGPVAGWTWGNSTIAVHLYDLDGNPTDIDSAGVSTYSYDDAFRIIGITDLVDASKTWTYGYDLLDRLNAASRSSETIGYIYDANGNRLTQTGTTAASYTVSPSSNRVTSISGTPTRTYGYDAAGNVTSYGGLIFTYSDAGRMSSVTSGSSTTTYILNALGQRVRKTGATATVHFVYDESGHLLGEYGPTGALIQETIWMGDIPVATLRSNGSGVDLYYVHTDHLNSPRRISRPSDNTILWRWDSDPFGSAAADEDPDGDATAFTYGLRFPGQYLDTESGLSYNYARTYDPQSGRYAQGDPIGLRGGINTFGYADQNPLWSIDPFGLSAQDVLNIREHIDSNFPEIHTQGGWEFGNPDTDATAHTNIWTGRITVDRKYAQECLTLDEFLDLYFQLLHESMHSTDSASRRFADAVADLIQGISSNHKSIFNRVTWEEQGIIAPAFAKDGLWGYGPNDNPRPHIFPRARELYEKTRSCDCEN